MRISKNSKSLIEKELNLILVKKKKIKDVAKFLGTSREMVGRWFKYFKENNEVKLKTHVPINKFPESFNEEVVEKYKDRLKRTLERFGDARVAGMWLSTIRYFKYIENIKCSEEHIRKILIANNFITHRTQKETKKQIKKNIKEQLLKTFDFEAANDLKDKIEVIENHNVYHGKSGVAGFRTEADGCFDHWFGKDKSCLYFIVDSFTGFIMDLWIEKEETNIGYLNLYKSAFKKYGKSVETRTDKRNGLAQGAIKDLLTSIGINHSSSSDPTFKPNVERALEDAQSLLPMYFMDNDINNSQEALARKNEILNFMNAWLKRSIPQENLFTQLNDYEITNFYIKRERIVINEVSHVSIDNKRMAPFRNGKRCLMNKKVVIYTDESNIRFVKENKIKIYLREIKDVVHTKEFMQVQKQIDFEKRKSQSYQKMLSKKVYLVNKKISHLNKMGYEIKPLDIST